MFDELFSDEIDAGPIVFSIAEESSAGGVSYCWVKSKPDGFHLYGSELGHMCGPAPCAAQALHGSGFQFGMEFMNIESSLVPDEFRKTLNQIDLSGVMILTINQSVVQSRKLDEIVSLYQSLIDDYDDAAQPEQDEAEADFVEEHGRSPDAQELHDWINSRRRLKR